jgi:RHS repeat-associated protein
MVRRNENGQQTVYLGKLYQHNLNTGIATRHYAFGGKLVALREGTNNVNFLLTDHLGSVTTTLFADGTVRANLRYDPWGKQRWASQTTPTRYRFTAQRFDDRLGLYDYNARYYDANIGRFISADTYVPGQEHMALTVDFHDETFLRWTRDHHTGEGPFTVQTLNRYTYVNNDPVRYVDPTGHETATVSLTGTEAEEIADALDSIIRLLQTSGQNYEAAAIIAGLIAALSSATAAAATIPAVIAFLAGIGIAAGALLTAGIIVAVVAGLGGAALLWNANAKKNAADSLERFSNELRSAAESVTPNGLLSLTVENRILVGDNIRLTGYGPTGKQILYNDTTSVLDNSGSVLISMMRAYADETGKRVTFMYWYGVYDYFGNGNWSRW